MWDSAGDATMSDLFAASYSDSTGEFDFSNTFKDTLKALGSQQARGLRVRVALVKT